MLIDSINNDLDIRWFPNNPQRYFEIKAALATLKKSVEESGATACDFAFEIDGILKDQGSYYIDTFTEITRKISEKGNEIMSSLTQQTNVTMSAPLAK